MDSSGFFMPHAKAQRPQRPQRESLGLPCRFEWQEGCGAFSVSCSQIDKIVAYIRNQEKHHRKKSFQQEYLGLLKKHRIEYDERYIWS
jgi:putative transposase